MVLCLPPGHSFIHSFVRSADASATLTGRMLHPTGGGVGVDTGWRPALRQEHRFPCQLLCLVSLRFSAYKIGRLLLSEYDEK